MDIQTLPIMNAAGGCKGPGPEFDALLRSAVTEITIGSITVDLCDGNSGDVFYIGEHGESVNSLGLPNPGIEISHENLAKAAGAIDNTEKQMRVSISGTGAGTEEYIKLIRMCIRAGVDTIEINVGCPNIWKAGARKPLLSHDPDALSETLAAIRQSLPNSGIHPRIAVKLSPMTPVSEPFEYRFGSELPPIDGDLLKKIAACLANFAFIDEVVLINTVPKARIRDEKNGWVIKSPDVPDGAGGLGGTPVFPLMLNHLMLFAGALPGMPLTAVGGISTGHDVRKALCAGASAVQIGTAWMRDATNARIFSDVLSQYVDVETPA